ncbi:MAG: O-antigen ligase family protein [Bacteroidia bacterium]|nr:O-antigen ligase family protein [Bacteroidia bacterium]
MIGNYLPQFNYVFVPFCIAWFYYIRRPDLILIAFFTILILGDSRAGFLEFSKNLRVVILVTMTLLSFNDLAKGAYQINKNILWFLPFFFVALIAVLHNDIYSEKVFELGMFKTISYFLLFFNVFHFIRFYVFTYGGGFLLDVIHLINIVLLIGLALILISPSFVFYLGSVRYRGLMGNPNGMGNLVTVTLPIYVYYFSQKSNFDRKYRFFSFGLLIISLLLCSSRNALFAVILFGVSFLALQGTIERMVLFFGAILPLLALLIYALPVYEIVVALGMGDYLRLSNVDSGSGRFFAWTWALEIIDESPVFGHGFYFEEYVFRNHMPNSLSVLGHQGGVHNSYLALLINTGIAGLAMQVLFYINLFFKVRNFRFLAPFLASLLFSATFESWLSASLNAFTIFFLIMVLILISPSETRQFKIE